MVSDWSQDLFPVRVRVRFPVRFIDARAVDESRWYVRFSALAADSFFFSFSVRLVVWCCVLRCSCFSGLVFGSVFGLVVGSVFVSVFSAAGNVLNSVIGLFFVRFAVRLCARFGVKFGFSLVFVAVFGLMLCSACDIGVRFSVRVRFVLESLTVVLPVRLLVRCVL